MHAANHAFPLLRTYGDTRPGEYLALVNSFGVIEIARAENSAAEGLGLCRGAPVIVRDRDRPAHAVGAVCRKGRSQKGAPGGPWHPRGGLRQNPLIA